MVNNIEVIGLNINSMSPSNGAHNVSVLTDVRITFNSDLDTSTIVGNFTILKDSNLNYVDEKSLEHISLYEPVKGDVSYENKTIIFRPVEQFTKSARYIVSVRQEAIRDITGKTMLAPFVSTFFTESVATLRPIEMTSPDNGVISDKAPVISWLPQEGSSAYIIEISKEKTFEVLSYQNIIKPNDVGFSNSSIDISNLDFKDGLYYIRIKSINGEWSDSTQFFIKKSMNERGIVSVEDIPDDIQFDNDYDEELIVLDYFPKENDVLVNTKINIAYIKVLGKVSIDDIDFNESFMVGELIDEEDEDVIVPHDFVKGTWNVVYDEEKDESFIVFVPIELGGS